MNRQVVVKRLPALKKGREIVISDIHANLDLYRRLLRQIDYRPGVDRLILLGDLIEKGTQNLEMVRYVMKQTQNEDVWCVMGNCDFIAKNVLYSYRLDFLKHVLRFREHSLIHEMAKQIRISMEEMPMDEFCQQLRLHFLPELSFLNDLPHVLESDSRIYAHAAIRSEDNYGDDFKEVMAMPMFLKRKIRFQKTVVVGHMPVTEYCSKIACFDPLYDAERNVWSIDGGNVVKHAGQLNALIFDGSAASTARADTLEEGTVVRDVAPSTQIPFFINWNNGEVDILKEAAKQCFVYSPYLNRSFWIDRAFLQCEQARVKGTDYTNYEMPLRKGDRVKIVFSYDEKMQIKKDGVLGWTDKKNIEPK